MVDTYELLFRLLEVSLIFARGTSWWVFVSTMWDKLVVVNIGCSLREIQHFLHDIQQLLHIYYGVRWSF